MATVNLTIQLLTISTMQFQCVLSNASCLPNVIHMLPHPPSPSLYHPFPPQTHTISLFPRVCVCVCECVLYRVVAILLHTFVHAHRQIEFMRCRQWVKLSQRVGQGAALISSCHGDDEDEGGDE